ncbi:putative multidrug resistance-associated protein [Zootermopsis nevadensis]|uniref:Putative multidrug resistance-associated protein n=1 Tax=Zootermopsis nevadensis TaxID=136037 RepID=A0A067QTS4_ZOONE|nr:putative multidrug resistance-associated protein [Zootermopsis nevadensis]
MLLFLLELDDYHRLNSVPKSLKLPTAVKGIIDPYSKQWFTAVYKGVAVEPSDPIQYHQETYIQPVIELLPCVHEHILDITGPCHSERTVLISGSILLGESVSYASQEPWMFTASVRQNILFGQLMDRNRYKQVVRACALERDFLLLPHGDMTIVGERGVTLSGGQRARINLKLCLPSHHKLLVILQYIIVGMKHNCHIPAPDQNYMTHHQAQMGDGVNDPFFKCLSTAGPNFSLTSSIDIRLGQPTMGDNKVWMFGVGLTTPHLKNLFCYETSKSYGPELILWHDLSNVKKTCDFARGILGVSTDDVQSSQQQGAKSMGASQPTRQIVMKGSYVATDLDLSQAEAVGHILLIEGGTAFMGKLLVENLLRSCPNLSSVYKLVRSKKCKGAESRLDDFFNNPVTAVVKLWELVRVWKEVRLTYVKKNVPNSDNN